SPNDLEAGKLIPADRLRAEFAQGGGLVSPSPLFPSSLAEGWKVIVLYAVGGFLAYYVVGAVVGALRDRVLGAPRARGIMPVVAVGWPLVVLDLLLFALPVLVVRAIKGKPKEVPPEAKPPQGRASQFVEPEDY